VNKPKTDLPRLAKEMRVGLFATAANFPQALSYAYGVIATLPKKDHAAAFTALHVVLNTIANEIDKIDSDYDSEAAGDAYLAQQFRRADLADDSAY
jgi:hypothetical protein